MIDYPTEATVRLVSAVVISILVLTAFYFYLRNWNYNRWRYSMSLLGVEYPETVTAEREYYRRKSPITFTATEVQRAYAYLTEHGMRFHTSGRLFDTYSTPVRSCIVSSENNFSRFAELQIVSYYDNDDICVVNHGPLTVMYAGFELSSGVGVVAGPKGLNLHLLHATLSLAFLVENRSEPEPTSRVRNVPARAIEETEADTITRLLRQAAERSESSSVPESREELTLPLSVAVDGREYTLCARDGSLYLDAAEEQQVAAWKSKRKVVF